MRDHTVEQHSTWNELALNCPYGDYPSIDSSHQAGNPQKNGQHALHCLCLESESTILYFSTDVSLPQP